MDEQELRQQIDRASKADTAKEVLKEVIQSLERESLLTFKQSDPRDHDAHMMVSLYLNILNDVEQRLLAAIAGGQAAEKALITKVSRRKLSGIL